MQSNGNDLLPLNRRLDFQSGETKTPSSDLPDGNLASGAFPNHELRTNIARGRRIGGKAKKPRSSGSSNRTPNPKKSKKAQIGNPVDSLDDYGDMRVKATRPGERRVGGKANRISAVGSSNRTPNPKKPKGRTDDSAYGGNNEANSVDDPEVKTSQPPGNAELGGVAVVPNRWTQPTESKTFDWQHEDAPKLLTNKFWETLTVPKVRSNKCIACGSSGNVKLVDVSRIPTTISTISFTRPNKTSRALSWPQERKLPYCNTCRNRETLSKAWWRTGIKQLSHMFDSQTEGRSLPTMCLEHLSETCSLSLMDIMNLESKISPPRARAVLVFIADHVLDFFEAMPATPKKTKSYRIRCTHFCGDTDRECIVFEVTQQPRMRKENRLVETQKIVLPFPATPVMPEEDNAALLEELRRWEHKLRQQPEHVYLISHPHELLEEMPQHLFDGLVLPRFKRLRLDPTTEQIAALAPSIFVALNIELQWKLRLTDEQPCYLQVVRQLRQLFYGRPKREVGLEVLNAHVLCGARDGAYRKHASLVKKLTDEHSRLESSHWRLDSPSLPAGDALQTVRRRRGSSGESLIQMVNSSGILQFQVGLCGSDL